jgi:16S rRNA (guanine527-N7)-methyltransferase
MKTFLEKFDNYEKTENKFSRYYSLLVEWNEKFNLTAITDECGVWLKHFADSVTSESLIKQGASILDVGSGAGFPGIPLKIVRDDISLTMLDSVNKKVTFLNEVVSQLELSNAQAIHSRIEDFDKKKKYDVVVSRAVAELRTLCEYTLPFVKEGGIFIAYKSEKTDEEIINAKNALAILGGEVSEVKEVSVGELTRKLVVIKKIKPTPPKYPRGKNLPRVKPL